MPRMLVNDQIVARLGELLGAPVPKAALIDVPAELIKQQPEMAHMLPGVAHGSGFIDGVTERLAIEHTALPENRPRFAALAVLFGWVGAQDHQFVYAKSQPNVVYSVDHGHFFPGGPVWSQNSIKSAPAVAPDDFVVQSCSVLANELRGVRPLLQAVTDDALARIIAIPPDTWDFTIEDRTELLQFLAQRRDLLVANL